MNHLSLSAWDEVCFPPTNFGYTSKKLLSKLGKIIYMFVTFPEAA